MSESFIGVLRWCSALAALALALTGCGGGGGGEAVSPTASAPTQLDQVAALTLAQQSVNARMAALPHPVALAAVSSGTATEDFENGMADWSNWGNAQVVAGAGTSGSKAMQVGTGAGGAGLTVPGIVPGNAYRLTAQVKVSDPSDPVFIGINMLDSSGNQVIGHSSPAVSSTGYVTVTVDLVAPANSANAVVWIWKNAGSGYASLDDVSFGPPTSPPPPPTTPPTSNLVSNGGFENGMTGWVNWGNASAVAGQANSGASALSVGTAAGGAGQTIGGITGGTVYRLVAQAKVSDPSETVFVGVNLLNQAGSAVTQMALPISSTTYGTVSFDITAPSDAASAVVYVWKNAGSGFGYVDDIVFGVAPGSAPPPPPPSSSNLIVNGGFENGLASWVNWANTVASTGQAAAGSYAAQVGTGAGGFGQYATGIVVGNNYHASAQVKVSSPDELGYFGLKFTDDAGNVLGQQYVTFNSTSYVTAQVDLAAPANATKALVYVWKNAGTGFAYADEVSLVQATPTSPVVVGNATSTARALAALTDGTQVAVWSDASGVFAQRFSTAGTIGDRVQLASTGKVDAAAALTGGGYAVEYETSSAVFVQLVRADGTLAPPVTLITAAQLAATSDGYPTEYYSLVGGGSVIAVGDGSFLASYVSSHPIHVPGDTGYGLTVQKFDAAGNAVGSPQTPNSAYFLKNLDGGAALPNGGFAFAHDGRYSNTLVSIDDAALQWQENYVSPQTGSEQSNMHAAGLSNGSFVAIWTGSDQLVRGQVFHVDPTTPGHTANDTGVITFAGAQGAAHVIALPDNRFLLTWGGGQAQVFDATGQPVTTQMQIASETVAVVSAGQLAALAQEGAQLVAHYYAI